MRDLFASTFLGNSAEEWTISAAFIVGGIVVGKAVSWISTNIMRTLSQKTANRVDDIILAIVEKPLVLIVSVAGVAIGVDKLRLNEAVQSWVDKGFNVVVALVAAWTLARIVDAIIDEYVVPIVEKTEGDLDDQLLPIIRKTIKAVIWIFAVVVALKNVGYDVGALLAGLGLGGVAIALAAKDTISNFFGSVAVFIDRPFKINDRIKIAGYDGTVVEIGIRTSRLKTLDNRIVTIPNASFASSPIENVTSEPHTKIVQTLELARTNKHAKLAEAVEILKAIGTEIEGTDGEPAAGVAGIGEYSYKTTFVFYVKKGANYLGTINAVNLEVLKRFEQAGIALALPTRTIVNS